MFPSVAGTKSDGRQRKRWIENVKDLYQRGSDVQLEAECIKVKMRLKKFLMQPAGEDERLKMRKKRRQNR